MTEHQAINLFIVCIFTALAIYLVVMHLITVRKLARAAIAYRRATVSLINQLATEREKKRGEPIEFSITFDEQRDLIRRHIVALIKANGHQITTLDLSEPSTEVQP